MTRIQRRRTKGWRKPPGAVSVTRPGPWGNPFTRAMAEDLGYLTDTTPEEEAARWLTLIFRDWLTRGPASAWWYADGEATWRRMRQDLPTLRGKTLVCWCPTTTRTGAPWPCHADVLAELAEETR